MISLSTKHNYGPAPKDRTADDDELGPSPRGRFCDKPPAFEGMGNRQATGLD